MGDRDWFDGLWESNCMFVSRKQLEQVGCFDENFTVAGGGYANLELYERLGSSPDISVATIIGEGSFHQVHGGTTTNQADAEERRSRVFGYSQHYAELRGRAFRGPGKPIHYVGRIATGAARRSKPRRMSTQVFAEAAVTGINDGRPTVPTPVPDELKWAFTEAVWRNLAVERHDLARPPGGHRTHRPGRLPGAHRPGPAAIGSSRRALATAGARSFLASICDLVGHGSGDLHRRGALR